MAKKMLIDATHAEETRVVVADGNKVEEFDFESGNKRQLAGNIYLAKVARVEPSLQAAFVDYGGNRHGFLAFSEIHPDYYQIPVADRQVLLEEERAHAEAMKEEDEKPALRKRRSHSRPRAARTVSGDAVKTGEISGMDVIDLEGGIEADTADEGADAESAVATSAEPLPDGAAPGDGGEYEADEDDGPRHLDASEKDDAIESVADEDVAEEIRHQRKPRPKRYRIQEVIKVRQILLVQVVKEERGNKGAALTTYLSLAGRYCVLMPNTARGGGISRKITNATDRKKLKTAAAEIEVPQGAGLIIRTAGAMRTKAEIKRDYEFLQRLWEQIRELTLKSIAPAKIYEEGDLIKRSIRDLYSREIDEVVVEGEAAYRTAKDFMKMIMPSHAKNVKCHSDPMPLFARYQVESYLDEMFNPTVRLKSGGYIVIGVTEALVAIDVNSGKATREGSIEETALRTNLEASEEVARQLRLRDLAGLIVIDFIDMDDRRNNAAVEKRLKEKLKTDRARIQVGRISGFGLLEMSRQRLRPGMIEVTTQPCNHCHGTGLIRSDDSLALTILRQLENEGVRRQSREVLLKAPVGVVNFLINTKREHLTRIEADYGLAIRVEADPFLISPDFSVERFKTATRRVTETAPPPVVSADAMAPDMPDEAAESPVSEEDGETTAPKKKRRRRGRRRRDGQGEMAAGTEESPGQAEAVADGARTDADAPAGVSATDEAPNRETHRVRRKSVKAADTHTDGAPAAASVEAPAQTVEEPAPKKRLTRVRRKKTAMPEEGAEAAATSAPPEAKTVSAAVEEKSAATPDPTPDSAPDSEPVVANESSAPVAAPAEAQSGQAPSAETPEPAVTAEPEKKPRRRGWWSVKR